MKNSIIFLTLATLGFIVFQQMNLKKFLIDSDYTHKSPVWYIPESLDPIHYKDRNLVQIGHQVHQTLFEMGIEGYPVPLLVQNFEFSSDFKQLDLNLKSDVTFSNGNTITCGIVKDSLDAAIANKGVGALALQKVTTTCLDRSSLEIRLTSSVPDQMLIEKLTSRALSIVDRNAPDIGSGPYEYKKLSDTKAELKLRPEFFEQYSDAPKLIELVAVSRDDAIKGYKEGLFDDLLSFEISKIEIDDLREISSLSWVSLPNFHTLFLNPRTLDLGQRAIISDTLDWTEIIKKHTDYGIQAVNLFAPGELGYSQKPLKKIEHKKIKKFTVGIGDDLPYLEDVKKYIVPQLKALAGEYIENLEIKYIKPKEIVNLWLGNNIDAFLYYLIFVPNTNQHFSFLPSHTLGLGDPYDTEIEDMAKDISEGNYYEQGDRLKKINERIGNSRVFAGGFYPGIYRVISNKYMDINEVPTFSPTLSYTLLKKK